jgi:hypothetical protein
MPEERIDHTNDAVERHPSLLLRPNVADCPPQAIGVIVLAAGNADSPSYARWRQKLSGIIAERLNLEHEIHHTVSKLCILGFEPLK